MLTVLRTDRGASDREVAAGVLDRCGLDVDLRRFELATESDPTATCAEADALIPA